MVNIGLLFHVFMGPKDVSYLDLEKECFESKTLGSACIIWEDIALSVKQVGYRKLHWRLSFISSVLVKCSGVDGSIN